MIDKWIKQLGDKKQQVRNKAQVSLIAAGVPALKALVSSGALNHNDPEVKLRANKIFRAILNSLLKGTVIIFIQIREKWEERVGYVVPQRRSDKARALISIIPILLEILSGKIRLGYISTPVKQTILKFLIKIGHVKLVDALIASINSRQVLISKIVMTHLIRLAKSGNWKAVKGLILALNSKNNKTAQEATRYLSTFSNTVQNKRKYLTMIHTRSIAPELTTKARKRVLKAIGRIQNIQSMQMLLELYSSAKSSDVKNMILNKLRRFSNSRSARLKTMVKNNLKSLLEFENSVPLKRKIQSTINSFKN